MNQNNDAKCQRKNIKAFQKELFSYTGQIAWFLPGFFSFVLLIFAMIPMQVMFEQPDYGVFCIMLVMLCYLAFLVLSPYVNVTDSLERRQKNSATWGKLKNLPVSRRQYVRVLLMRLVSFFWKLTLIAMILQFVCADPLFEIRPGFLNFLYIAGAYFVVPVAWGWLWSLCGVIF